MTAVVWFRRDLRIHDNPALRAALDEHDEVIPAFVFDDRILHGRNASGPRTQFLLDCLADLREQIPLVIRHGDPATELAELGDVVYHAGQYPGLGVVDDLAGEKAWKVFTPYYRRWLEQPRRDVLQAPRRELKTIRDRGTIPSLEELGLEERAPDAMRGGEAEARRRLDNFVRRGYEQESHDRTSRLSPYLRFGCVSPRELEERVDDEEFRRQLCWRDFYLHVLIHDTKNPRNIRWEHDPEAFRAWCEGLTGFPLVDAGMRQLKAEGWMPNRVRLVVASFLTKDLGIDWRLGERWFMRWLLDGDVANNNGNWRWIAGEGVDRAPAWRRLYNPELQRERYDPDGTYVARWVPEYGTADYPEPIVDHRAAREAALARYREA